MHDMISSESMKMGHVWKMALWCSFECCFEKESFPKKNPSPRKRFSDAAHFSWISDTASVSLSLLLPACQTSWPLCVCTLICLFTPLSFKWRMQPRLCCSGPPTMTTGLVYAVNHLISLHAEFAARVGFSRQDDQQQKVTCALCDICGLSGQTLLLLKLSRMSPLLFL